VDGLGESRACWRTPAPVDKAPTRAISAKAAESRRHARSQKMYMIPACPDQQSGLEECLPVNALPRSRVVVERVLETCILKLDEDERDTK
jgi:hypothetical protein